MAGPRSAPTPCALRTPASRVAHARLPGRAATGWPCRCTKAREPPWTYPARARGACELFYRIRTRAVDRGPRSRGPRAGSDLDRPASAAASPSTGACSRAARRWQQFLSTPGGPYIEIQAGLASDPDPIRAHAARTEGLARGVRPPGGGPQVALQSGDWNTALGAVEKVLETWLPPRDLFESLDTKLPRGELRGAGRLKSTCGGSAPAGAPWSRHAAWRHSGQAGPDPRPSWCSARTRSAIRRSRGWRCCARRRAAGRRSGRGPARVHGAG